MEIAIIHMSRIDVSASNSLSTRQYLVQLFVTIGLSVIYGRPM